MSPLSSESFRDVWDGSLCPAQDSNQTTLTPHSWRRSVPRAITALAGKQPLPHRATPHTLHVRTESAIFCSFAVTTFQRSFSYWLRPRN